MLCRISGYTVVEALVNLRCARTALPEYWPLARTRARQHMSDGKWAHRRYGQASE
jgi:hypothetical protein